MFPAAPLHKLSYSLLGIFIMVFILLPAELFAQTIQPRVLSLSEAVNMAISNHPASKIADMKTQEALVLQKRKMELPPAEFNWDHGQLYGISNDNRIILSQNLGSPFAYAPKNKYLKNQLELAELSAKITQKQLVASVKEAYFTWVHQMEYNQLLKEETSLYENLLEYMNSTMDSAYHSGLDKIMAETQATALYKRQLQAEEQILIETNRLNRLIYAEGPFVPAEKELDLYTIQFPDKTEDKFYPTTWKDYFQKMTQQKTLEVDIEKAKLFPEIHLGYMYQQIDPLKTLNGFELGISLPLWSLTQSGRIKAAHIHREIAIQNESLQNYNLEQTLDDLKIQLDQQFISITYYREKGMNQSDEVIKMAGEQFQNHKLTISEYILITGNALKIKEDYLESLLNYNIHAIELEYYIN